MSKINPYFVTVGGGQVHYLRGGSGPTLVLLHPLIGSSKSFRPILRLLADDFTVIAPDLPGFGLSDPIDATIDLDVMAGVVLDFIECLNLREPVLYGRELGAIIASRIAESEADKVSMIIAHDFPLESNDDGAKKYTGEPLIALWQELRDHHLSRLERNKPTPELDQIQQEFIDCAPLNDPFGAPMELIRAFDGYEALTAMQGRVEMIESSDKPAPTLPLNMGYTSFNDIDLVATLTALANDAGAQIAPPPVRSEPLPSPFMTKAYQDVGGRDILMQGRAGTGDTAILALHELGLSADSFADVFEGLRSDITLLAPDIPHDITSMDEITQFIGDCLALLPQNPVILVRDASAGVVLAALTALGAEPRGLILDLPVATTPEIAEKMCDFIAFDTTPKSYGEHIVHAIGRMRDRGLFWPWHNHDGDHHMHDERQLDPSVVRERVIKALSNPHYADQLRLALGQPVFDAVRDAPFPIAFLANPRLPISHDIKQLSRTTKLGLYLEMSGVEGIEAGLAALGY